MWRAARKLGGRASNGKRVPPLLFFTDPERTPDPIAIAIASGLPRGAGVVYRAFGAADAARTGSRLKAVCRRRGLTLLIGGDERLAAVVRADGLHLPERAGSAAGAVRRRRPGWLLTIAAHSPAAVRRAMLAGADAAVVSTAFPSRSKSAGRPLGPLRLSAMARLSGGCVIALGGVNPQTTKRLVGTPVVSAAAVEAFSA
jgi:thiamine-phosphate pyrophosphorylase